MKKILDQKYRTLLSKVPVVSRAERAIKDVTGINHDEFVSRTRQRHYVMCRIFFLHACGSSGISNTDLSAYLNLDHSTGIHYKKQYKNMMQYDKFARMFFTNLQNRFDELEAEYGV